MSFNPIITTFLMRSGKIRSRWKAYQYQRRYHILLMSQESLRRLEDAISACRLCPLCEGRNNTVPGAGPAIGDGGSGPLQEPDRHVRLMGGRPSGDVGANFGHLAGLLRMYAYQPQMAATLPLLLHEAAQGRYESLLAQSRMLMSQMSDAMAIGMSLSVTCSEDADEFASRDADADTVLGNLLVDTMKQQCAVWPKGQRAANFRTPLSGDVPVLAINGEFDQFRVGENRARRLRQDLEVVHIQGATHFAPMTHPAPVAKAIREFADGLHNN